MLGLVLAVTLSPDALAQWQATVVAGAQSRSTADLLVAGSAPGATIHAFGNVTVSWTAPTAGAPAAGYEVRAYSALTGIERGVAAACTGLVKATSCVEAGAQSGTWRYTITPRQQAWAGTESPRSNPVVVI